MGISPSDPERVIIYRSPNKNKNRKKPDAPAREEIKAENARPSVATIHAIHPQMVINKLKPVKDDFLKHVETQGSISQLSFSVNDAAGGKTFEECYEKQEILGEGGFAVVYRCYHHERMHTYAVKEIMRDNYECSGENLREEIDALKRLRDVPYIVRLLDVFHETDVCYMVMEEMRGGDLLDRLCDIEVYEEPDARKVSRKLLEAIYFCHKKNIVHRDIKPENILLSSKENHTSIKLADFGCSRQFVPGELGLFTLCGSPQYVAPELYTHENGYDERCDLWSAAVVIYVVLGGYAPFDGEDHALSSIICNGLYEFHEKYWSEISEPPKDLIRSLLKVDPMKRATLEQALDSEWLKRRDRDSIKKSTMDGSLSSFDAWCQSQNSGFSGQGSSQDIGTKMQNLTEEGGAEEDDEVASVQSLQPDDL